MKSCGFNPLGENEATYNAGIIGGRRESVIELFNKMIHKLRGIDKSINANMAVYNETLRAKKRENWNVVTGHPLHNQFKRNHVDKGVLIKHK